MRSTTGLVRAVVWVDGEVQGVGFRWWVMRTASDLGLAGYAQNLYDGRVEVCAQGPQRQVDALVAQLVERRHVPGRPGHVRRSLVTWPKPDPSLVRFDVR